MSLGLRATCFPPRRHYFRLEGFIFRLEDIMFRRLEGIIFRPEDILIFRLEGIICRLEGIIFAASSLRNVN